MGGLERRSRGPGRAAFLTLPPLIFSAFHLTGPPMTLVSIPANPVPDNVVSGTIKTPDGAELRFARWAPPAGRKGTVCVFTGRSEQIEKYFETVRDLRDRGFAVAMIDWRGQGHSSRRLRDPRKGYVRDFSDYEIDVETFVQQVVLPDCPPPHFALAHSMGGAVMLRVAHAGKRWFDRMVLSAPMIDLPGRRTSFPAARAVARAAARRAGRPLHSRRQRRRWPAPSVHQQSPDQRSRALRPQRRDPRGRPDARHRLADGGLGRYRVHARCAASARVRLSVANPPADPDAGRQQRHRRLDARRSRSSPIICAPARIWSSPARSTRSCRSRTATARSSGRRSTPSCRARRCSGEERPASTLSASCPAFAGDDNLLRSHTFRRPRYYRPRSPPDRARAGSSRSGTSGGRLPAASARAPPGR